jgi:hypothetical protein
MNPAVPQIDRWSPQRWVLAVILFFALQVGLVLALSDRVQVEPQQAVLHSSVRLLTDAAASRNLFDALAAPDPALLALIQPVGSGDLPRAVLPSQETLDWAEPERWFTRSGVAMSVAFGPFVRTNAAIALRLADKLRSAPLTINVSREPALSESSLRIEGALQDRPPAGVVKLRSWRYEDVLEDSVVELWVNPAGNVFSPRLVGSATANNPAQREADQFALGVARSLRFQARPSQASGAGPGGFTTGRLIFRWHTTPPAARPQTPM